jgi:hypothetical protein
MDTTQISRLETNLSNLRMDGFENIDVYIGRFKNMKDDILT